MPVTVVVELTCDQCERTEVHRLANAAEDRIERFVGNRLAAWHIGEHGDALCPTCLYDAVKLAQRAERSARDKARARGELSPTPRTVTIPIRRNPKEN